MIHDDGHLQDLLSEPSLSDMNGRDGVVAEWLLVGTSSRKRKGGFRPQNPILETSIDRPFLALVARFQSTIERHETTHFRFSHTVPSVRISPL
jgi:hypothetical protein